MVAPGDPGRSLLALTDTQSVLTAYGVTLGFLVLLLPCVVMCLWQMWVVNRKFTGPKNAGGLTFRQQALVFVFSSSPVGDLISIAQITCSFISCVIFIVESYHGMNQDEYFIFLMLELLFTPIYTIDFCVRLYFSDNRIAFLFYFSTFVDVFTTIPIWALSIMYATNTMRDPVETLVFLRFARMVKVFSLVRILKWARARFLIGLQREIFQLGFVLAALIFIFTGIFQIVETAGGTDVEFHEVLYFMMITVLGRPTVNITTTMGYYTVMILVMGASVFVPLQLSKIFEIWQIDKSYRASYSINRRSKHIVLCGDVSSNSVGDFLKEFYHEGRAIGKNLTKSVVVSRLKMSNSLRTLFELPELRQYVMYIRGTVMEEADLDRAAAHDADAIFILSKKFNRSADEEDLLNIARTLAIKTYRPDARMFVQILKPENKKHILALPQVSAEKDTVISVWGFKMNILANNCLTEGVSTLIANLTNSYDVHGSLPHFAKKKPIPGWMEEYRYGTNQDLFFWQIPERFKGHSFTTAIREIYEKFGVMMFGVGMKDRKSDGVKEIILNPGREYIIRPDDIGCIIAAKDQLKKLTRTYKQVFDEYHMVAEAPRASMMQRRGSNADATKGWGRARLATIFMTGAGSISAPVEGIVTMASSPKRSRNVSLGHTVTFADDQTPKSVQMQDISIDPVHADTGRDAYEKKLRRKAELRTFVNESKGYAGDMGILALDLVELLAEGGYSKIPSSLSGLNNPLKMKPKSLQDYFESHDGGGGAGLLPMSDLNSGVMDDVLGEDFKNHIVVCGSVSAIEYFLDPLRAPNMDSERTVVILHESEPSEHIVAVLAGYHRVFYVQGNPLDSKDLERAGISNAAMAVILANPEKARAFITSEDDIHIRAIDTDAIVTTFKIRELNPSIKVVTELLESTTARFLEGQYNSGTPTDISEEFRFSAAFASGAMFPTALIDAIVIQAYYNEHFITIIKQMLDSNPSSDLASITGAKAFSRSAYTRNAVILMEVPDGCIGGTYDDLAELLFKKDIVPLGLYRGRSAHDTLFNFVYTNPKKGTIVNGDDKVYVLKAVIATDYDHKHSSPYPVY